MMPWNAPWSPPARPGWALWYTLTSLDAALATLQEEIFTGGGPPVKLEPEWMRAYA